MAKPYVEIEFKEPPRAFYLERGGEEFFLNSIQKLNWYKSDVEKIVFDLVLESPDVFYEQEIMYGEWFVIYSDGSADVVNKETFEKLYRTK